MVFVYIILSAILLYYAIKYGIRDGLIDRDANKEKLIYLNKNESIFEEIDDIYRTVNKEKKSEAKRIYDESYDVLLSKTAPKEKYDTLVQYKQKIKNLENG
ncbi:MULTISPECIES: hypothetical protein [Staphylococcus]|uniref:Phage protein n=1 Tax=Staphylococcus arlettae TaxID=29378 RepID=A0A1W5QDB9_9STAP|nr:MULTISPECIES: hypothetical protein [Staphylococcus]APY23807.1 hypothetical protein [Staphylococcus arlettae]EJY95761.1 hypothetical protein SARL_05942 [Staphylococcus arlettae CVD059]ERF48575.1 hypothetical protein N039_02665 [Staphylococcus sp. EGD-HP3]KAB2478892.1 hypothetical protein F9B39_07765 [Staphylococcus sp. CH99b_3]MBF0737430.1 hypothetical protein [Staphylococcus arlettae]